MLPTDIVYMNKKTVKQTKEQKLNLMAQRVGSLKSLLRKLECDRECLNEEIREMERRVLDTTTEMLRLTDES